MLFYCFYVTFPVLLAQEAFDLDCFSILVRKNASVDGCSNSKMKSIRNWKKQFQTTIFDEISLEESKLLDTYKTNPEKAKQMITTLNNIYSAKLLNETRKKLIQLKTNQ